jgi:hypothetical protein
MRPSAAVIGFAASGSAEPGRDRIQLAQAQESGAQTGAAAGAKERGGAANRDNSGAATTRSSPRWGAAAGAASSGERTKVRQETQGTSQTLQSHVGSHPLRRGAGLGSRRQPLGSRRA